jgi:hypothetical protein
LRENDNDEFLMHWVFGVCDLNEVRVQGRDLADPAVYAGSTDNEFLQLIMICDSGYDDEKAVLTSFKLTYAGTDPLDIAPNGIKVYDDVDFSGHYEPGTDTLMTMWISAVTMSQVPIPSLEPEIFGPRYQQHPSISSTEKPFSTGIPQAL